MKNTLIKTLAALAVAFAVGNVAQANPIITGGIAFSSFGAGYSPELSGTNPTLNIENEFVSDTSGAGTTFNAVPLFTGPISFAAIDLVGTFPTFTSLSVTNALGGELWSFTSGLETYGFTATSASIAESGSSWLVSGSGVFSISGAVDYASTDGTYHIHLSQNGTVTSVGATSDATAVPDTATTALLVGLGVLALGVYASRSRRVKA